ncbi:GntR family transcriptional regulator [Azospirillum picis]|uniref:DNA-binding GntR family transcriptional regulator n=1 Tax=Azospirillum picis TaxID=488438 RepID=A0ABU0MIJ7_9PROT|nr:GntR family transcriptional regulator [Azospirillum picis]MBP2299168.1 DNA-binding GntR family transcriptional regulator [Azospirillum picis]MDQ0533194.1 DNA-binding GntR family transcriptional regulator [Azospirillum picis]
MTVEAKGRAGGSVVARVPKATFRAHIADALRAAILNGNIEPGAQVIETALAEQFGVSRGPLREAMRQLIDEGLLVAVPYTGTHVVDLSVDDVREIYSMRVTLEIFAFEQIWARRDQAFRRELVARHDALTACIDAQDDAASIIAELQLHGFVYEATGHKLLIRTWESIRGRLQLYWAAHHRAHGIRGPRREGHDRYVEMALADDIEALKAEIADHMARGGRQTEDFLRGRPASAGTA